MMNRHDGGSGYLGPCFLTIRARIRGHRFWHFPLPVALLMARRVRGWAQADR